MPETEQQDSNLSELVVKEAISIGMGSPMRDPILEAVREAEGSPGRSRGVSMLGAGVALGAAAGYVLGSRGEDLSVGGEELPVDGEELAPDRSVVEDITEQVAGGESDEASGSEGGMLAGEETAEPPEGSGSSRLGRFAMVVGIVAAVALLRRRLSSGEAEEWEPIEDFESTVESAAESAAEETEEAADEGDDEGEMAEADTDDDADEE